MAPLKLWLEAAVALVDEKNSDEEKRLDGLLASVQIGAALISLWLAQETRGRNLELVSQVA